MRALAKRPNRLSPSIFHRVSWPLQTAKCKTYQSPQRSENRAKIEALIFDLDGPIVDSNNLQVEAWDLAFHHFGKRFPKQALRKHVGKGSDQYLPEFLTMEELKKMGKQIDQYRSALFRKEFLSRVEPFLKIRELFERIKRDGRRSGHLQSQG